MVFPPAHAGEQSLPHGGYFVDLILKSTCRLPLGVRTGFVSTDVKLDQQIGHLDNNGAFFSGVSILPHASFLGAERPLPIPT
jgi:hypothetical protein